MARIGATMEELDQLKRTFDNQSVNVADLSRNIDGVVHSTNWEGPAADRFRQAWDSDFKPMLERLRGSLGDAGTEVGRRRDALQAAGS